MQCHRRLALLAALFGLWFAAAFAPGRESPRHVDAPVRERVELARACDFPTCDCAGACVCSHLEECCAAEASSSATPDGTVAAEPRAEIRASAFGTPSPLAKAWIRARRCGSRDAPAAASSPCAPAGLASATSTHVRLLGASTRAPLLPSALPDSLRPAPPSPPPEAS